VLAEHFARRMASELGWERWPGFAPGAVAALERYSWPGNVRELRNVVERAVYRWDFRRAGGRHHLRSLREPWKPTARCARPKSQGEAAAPCWRAIWPG
jgi:psp operon transcriptional activator